MTAEEMQEHALASETAKRRALSFAGNASSLARPPTLPPIAPRSQDITDADLGMARDDIAQEAAERFIRCATAFTTKQAVSIVARKPPVARTIEIALPADAFEIDPDDAADLLTELERVIARPRPRWLDEVPPVQ